MCLWDGMKVQLVLQTAAQSPGISPSPFASYSLSSCLSLCYLDSAISPSLACERGKWDSQLQQLTKQAEVDWLIGRNMSCIQMGVQVTRRQLKPREKGGKHIYCCHLTVGWFLSSELLEQKLVPFLSHHESELLHHLELNGDTFSTQIFGVQGLSLNS